VTRDQHSPGRGTCPAGGNQLLDAASPPDTGYAALRATLTFQASPARDGGRRVLTTEALYLHVASATGPVSPLYRAVMSASISGVMTTRIRVWPGPRLAKVCTVPAGIKASSPAATIRRSAPSSTSSSPSST